MGLPALTAADMPVPQAIREFAGSRTTTLLWRNGLGGVTALVGNHSGSDVIIKWQPTVTGTSLADEAERMVWLQGRHPVPELVEHRSLNGAELLVTAALPTLSAVDGRWLI